MTTNQGNHGTRPPDGRPHNPAAERNKAPIREVLQRVLPTEGLVLEIASGPGTHVAHFARALPGLDWQPSEREAELRREIEARRQNENLGNVHPPLDLDVLQSPWPLDRADAMVCINLTHVAPWAATPALFAGAARILPAGGVFVLYGPFRRDGRHTAASNEEFDRALRARDPDWGLRDVEAVSRAATAHGLTLTEVIDMPANNLCLVFRQPDSASA